MVRALAKIYFIIFSPRNSLNNYKIFLLKNFKISKKDVKLNSLKDLEGKKVMAYGQNNVPDMIMKAALAKEGVNAVVEYVASVADTAAYLANVNDEYDYTLKADVCLACVVIILMFRLLIMYLYK